MNLSRFPAIFLVLGLLAAGPVAPAAFSGRPEGPPERQSLGHEGVPEKFPERPVVGEEAPDFRLRDVEGRWRDLGEFLGRGYLVLFFGSASSANFRRSAPEMGRLATEWERLEVKVILVYTREAHPATLREAPRNFGERAALARQVRKDLGLGIPVLVDEWDDAVHRSYGAMPDAAFLLDPRGKILMRQARAGAASLEKELRRLLEVPEPPR